MNLSTATTRLHAPPSPVAHARRPLLTPLPLEGPGHFLLVVDNSSLEKFVTCPMSARNYLVLGREPQAKNAALTFGGAVHAGLETLLKGPKRDEHGVPDDDTGFTSAINQSVLQFFLDNPAPPDEYRTPQVAIEVLHHYREKLRWDRTYDMEIKSDDTGPLIERAFELPLGVVEVGSRIDMPWMSKEEQLTQAGSWASEGQGDAVFVSHIHIAWSGRIDVIAHCNGRVRVVDHKTTSVADDKYYRQFQLSSQVMGYIWAARQLWPDFDVSAFCLNAIHLKRPQAGKGYPAGLTTPGVRGGAAPLTFFRNYYEYTPARIERWAQRTRVVISDFIHCLVRNDFPEYDAYCVNKFGVCPYHDACSEQDEAVRDNILMSSMFKPVTWNPTANR